MTDEVEHSWHDDVPKKRQRVVIFPFFGRTANDEAAPVPESGKQKQASELCATITRADGTVVDLGIVAAYYVWYLQPRKWLAWLLHGKRAAKKRSLSENAFHNRQVAKES